jgi:K+-sensing histidine kinase KdpD
MTVVAGYVRMLLKDRAGPLSDQQRRLLEEADKSCARLSALLAEVSDLSNLEAGTATFNRSTVDLKAILAEAIGGLPAVPDREIEVELTTTSPTISMHADQVRLRTAVAAILNAVRRELVTTDRLVVREQPRDVEGRPCAWIMVCGADRIDQLSSADHNGLTTFDEWRGGSGLSLVVARRVIDAHEGRLWSPAEDAKAAAVIALPHD